MKYLIVFPPVFQPFTPHLAVPYLCGQLKKEGYDAKAIDLNIEFYNDILKKSYLEKTIKNLEQIRIDSATEAAKYNLENTNINDYPIEIQTILLKNKTLNEYFKKNSNLIKTIPKEVEKAVSNIKNPKRFFDPLTYVKSYKTIHLALEIASLPYSPVKIFLQEYNNPLLKFNYETIKYNVFSNSTNIFIDYYEKWIQIIKKKNTKFIGISINTNEQIVPGLTLANLLKKHTNAHISIVGNHFSRIADNIIKHPEFFDIFADSIALYGGEKTVLELAKYFDKKISIDDVPNIIYKKNNEIIINKKCGHTKLNELTPNFDDYKFKKYLVPKITLPIQTSRGCYWGKCIFCDHMHEKQYDIKNVDNIINEIKHYKKKYGVTNFEMLDLAINPNYLEKLAEKIIQNKLHINYHCYLRTDQNFTKEIFEKARKSGLRIGLWGIESGSERIINLINKGVDFNKRIEILKESSDADIWNHAFAMFGFPFETIEEAKETIKLITTNSNIIDSCSLSKFRLSRHSKVRGNPEQYGITSINHEDNEFNLSLQFNENEITQEKINELNQIQSEADKTIFKSSLWKCCQSIHYLFLYISHYGADWVKNYKIDTLITKK